MNEYDPDAVAALESLPEGTLMMIPATGEIFRRTAYGADSRHQWVKLVHDEDTYYMFSDEILAIDHTVIWRPKTDEDRLAEELAELMGEDLADLAKDISNRTWTPPGLAPGLVVVEGLDADPPPAAPAATAAPNASKGHFSEADYPSILKALELKHEVTLEPGRMADPNGDNEDGWLILGSLSYQKESAHKLSGVMDVQALHTIGVDVQKDIKRRLKTFVQPDGEIGLELTYYPNKPYDDEEMDKLFADTNIGALITRDELSTAIDNDEEWVEDCFGGMDIYDLYFEAVKPGVTSPYSEDGNLDSLIDTPLWFQRGTERYKLNIWLHED